MQDKVYLAGTDDVKWVIEKIYDALIGFSYEPIWFHKKFPISSDDTMAECLKNVKHSNRMILVLDKRYGLLSRGKEISITEEEFLTAYENDIPILAFISSETYNQSEIYHKMKKKRAKVSSKKIKELGFKADKRLYEFIERIQHMKKNDETKICWIEQFNYIGEILEQIKHKWEIQQDIQFIKFVAPWVLPNESIPVHVNWNQDFDYDYVKIEYQNGLKLDEVINVKNYKEKKKRIFIKKDQIRHLSGEEDFPNYFGIVFNYTDINFEQLKLFKDINIQFLKKNEIIHSIELVAKIFRPILKNITTPESIILNDQIKNYVAPINLECTGFGFISINIQVKINKLTLSLEEARMRRIEKRLRKKYYNIIENFDKEDIEEKLKTSKEAIEHFLKALDDYILNESEEKPILTDYLSKENVEVTFIFDFIMELFKEMKVEYQFENVLLESTNLELPKENFNEFIRDIIISVHYKDLKGNAYPPVKIPLEINDIRETPQNSVINFEIKIKDIIDNTYHDIEKIERD